MRLETSVFTGYLRLVDYQMLQRFNIKLPILTHYKIIKISKHTIKINIIIINIIYLIAILHLFIYFSLDENYNFNKICCGDLY